MAQDHLDPAELDTSASTLADLKAHRERLLARRAMVAYQRAQAEVQERALVARLGRLLRLQTLQALGQLAEQWLNATQGEADETRVHHAMSQVAHNVLTALAPEAMAAAASQNLPAGLVDAYTRGATPRQLLTVSQWAERHRILKSGTNSPGPWRNELTPYLTELQDALSEHSSVRQVTFIKSSGVGGTEALYNWLGYVMHHQQNKDLLVVVPTLELRDRSFNPRFAKMLEESPALAALAGTAQRSRVNRGDLIEYGARARVIKAGANSPDSLRSDHLPYVICDEVDAFPWDVGGEGDPMTLIENRQRTFSRAKTYCVSTPTAEATSRIALLYSRSDQRRYHVPCPHCGEHQSLEFGGGEHAHGLKWRTAPEEPGQPLQVVAAWYVCQHCGAEIEEKHKPNMLAAGRWVAKHPQRRHHRGYHLNALYAPTGLGLGWVKIAQKWLDVQGDTSELKAFVNTYLGEVWKEQGDSVDANSLLARTEAYAEALPIQTITAGVDIQKDRIEASIVGWGAGEQGWLLDHLIIPGDTTQGEVWDELHDALLTARVALAAIDSGYNTSFVHDFCARHAWCIPVKGIAGAGRPLVEDEKRRRQRLRNRRKKGQPIEPVGVDQAKTLIYARLKLEQAGPGYLHFANSGAFDGEYFAQLAAERLVTKVRGTRPFLEWVQLRPRNEALDCLVYALAALRLAPLLLKRSQVQLQSPVVPGQSATQATAQAAAPARPEPAAGGKGRIQLTGLRFGARS
jgi:phage terminase large subunit GpA-like protein